MGIRHSGKDFENVPVLTLKGLCLASGLISVAVFFLSSLYISAYIGSNFSHASYALIFADWLIFGFLIFAGLFLPVLYAFRNWRWNPIWMIVIFLVIGSILLISFESYGLFLIPLVIDVIIYAYLQDRHTKQQLYHHSHSPMP